MDYHLLTGATGLLGRYLLRDLSLAGIPLAVVVRPTRKMTVDERIDAIMNYWEDQLGMELRRPIVLEGDLCQPNLGLDEESLDWVSQNVGAMIHSAASLTFYATNDESEPWRSNVQGVQHVLDLCRENNIRNFHHVSTAYVCGLRTDTIMEDDVDVGQTSGNDYEKSKLQAEKMVRSADCFDSLTVHRPAIIIGDSQNGFTNTFHGFYAALQLSYTLINARERNETGKVGRQSARLSLDGTESKNLIPVDWASAVMSHVITHPEHHGKTYHLTPLHAVKSRTIRDILEQSIGFYATEFVGPDETLDNPSEVEQLFYDHIHVYNSYWRDDPIFDSTNTQQAAPHLLCPYVDLEMLQRLAQTAIDMRFSFKERPKKQLSKTTA